jgi:hypothetical protein
VYLGCGMKYANEDWESLKEIDCGRDGKFLMCKDVCIVLRMLRERKS